MRACTSSNSRTFSIAITAWSAKVVDQLDLLVGERLDLLRGKITMTPIESSLRAAAARRARYERRRASLSFDQLYSGSASTSAMWIVRPSSDGAADAASRDRAGSGVAPRRTP